MTDILYVLCKQKPRKCFEHFRGLFKGRISIHLSLVCGRAASSKEGVPLTIYNIPLFFKCYTFSHKIFRLICFLINTTAVLNHQISVNINLPSKLIQAAKAGGTIRTVRYKQTCTVRTNYGKPQVAAAF